MTTSTSYRSNIDRRDVRGDRHFTIMGSREAGVSLFVCSHAPFTSIYSAFTPTEARALAAALDGDPRGYDAGFAAGLEAAVKVIETTKSKYGSKAILRETVFHIIKLVRAIPTPPNPVPGLEARVRELEDKVTKAREILSKNSDPHRIARLAKLFDFELNAIQRAALEGPGS